jgi:glycosyltransferase involved in cell wall biosynthesis
MTLICHINPGLEPFDARIFSKECLSLKERYKVLYLTPVAGHSGEKDGITVIDIKPPSKGWLGRLKYRYYYLFRLVLKLDAAVYHFHEPAYLGLAWLLKLKGKNVIWDIRKRADYEGKGLRKRLIRWAKKNLHIILSQRSFIPDFNDTIRNECVIENFCDMNLAAPHQHANRTATSQLFYYGPLDQEHGLFEMFHLLYLLHKKKVPVSLCLVGELSDPLLSQMAEELPYYAQIKHKIKRISPVDLPASLREADNSFAGLYLVKQTPENSDVYPQQIFDYMGIGMPVIASNISLYKGVVEFREAGFCVSLSDEEDLNEAAGIIEKLYLDKALQAQMGKNAIEAVERSYNWKTEKQLLLDFYRNITG